MTGQWSQGDFGNVDHLYPLTVRYKGIRREHAALLTRPVSAQVDRAPGLHHYPQHLACDLMQATKPLCISISVSAK